MSAPALTELKGVGPKTAEKLLALGIENAETLLLTLPKTYLDLSSFGDVTSAKEGDFLLFRFQVAEKRPLIRKSGRTTAIVGGLSDGAKVKLVFFNRDYVLNALKIGLEYRVYGKISKKNGATAVNPQFEEESETPKLTGVLPVYRTKGGIPQQTYRNIVGDALQRITIASEVADRNRGADKSPESERAARPESVRNRTQAAENTENSIGAAENTRNPIGPDAEREMRERSETCLAGRSAPGTDAGADSEFEPYERRKTEERNRLKAVGFSAPEKEELSLSDALRFVHRPRTIEEAKAGAERVLLEKTVRAMRSFRREQRLAGNKRTRRYRVSPESVEALKRAFPFSLNESQMVAIDTIIAALRRETRFSGVLTGDVGSGKTAVALFLAGYAALSGYQAVFMAPTELVAAQHYENAVKTLGRLGIRCALLTSSVKGRARTELLKGLKNREIDFLIGTQAVLNGEAELPSLAFAIVDEQHRFGVGTRNALFRNAGSGAPDALMMSATPIPRTLRLLTLGAHEALTLAPRFDKKNVKTRVVFQEKLDGMLRYIAERSMRGGLSFIVAPRISDMEGIPTAGAEEVYRDFTARFPEAPAALLTGKMPFAEKEAAAKRFRAGEVRVLIATTVIEVGLDVPDADTIAVMHADRLGLSTLHQLRGRVGRSGNEAYCFLYTERAEEAERLKILTETQDGMRIAEADFRLRGAGEIVGASQHGADRVLAGVTEEILLKAKFYVEQAESDVAAASNRGKR